MGIFHEMVTVVNRAPIPLNVRFDGQETTIPPGPSQLPKVCINYAKNQNPIMGTQDPNNPSITGARYLIGIVAPKGHLQKDPIDPLTKEEWEEHLGRPCRLNETEFFEGRLAPGEHVEVKGRGRKTQARGSFDTGVRIRHTEEFGAND